MKTIASIFVFVLLSGAAVQPPDESKANRRLRSEPTAGTTRSDYPLSLTKDASDLPSRIALTTADEPGEKMSLSGTVYETDGVTPVRDAVVYFYQTDMRGVYSDDECNNGCPRLRGYLKTDAKGQYEIRSIKPGHYPHIKTQAHLHVHLWAPNQPESIDFFTFYDDPLHSDLQRAASDKAPSNFDLIKLVRDETGVLRGVRNIKPRAARAPSETSAAAAHANPELEEELRKIVLAIMKDALHGFSGGAFRPHYVADSIYTAELGDSGLMHPLEKERQLDLEDVRVREYGETVVMDYRIISRIELKNQKFTKSSRATVVFLRRDGNWKLISYHGSPVGFERTQVTVDPSLLDSYAGRYENPLRGIYDVSREVNTLVFTSANGYRTEYLPESENEFFLKDEKQRREMLQTVTFVRNDRNEATHCLFRENDGRNIVARKTR